MRISICALLLSTCCTSLVQAQSVSPQDATTAQEPPAQDETSKQHQPPAPEELPRPEQGELRPRPSPDMQELTAENAELRLRLDRLEAIVDGDGAAKPAPPVADATDSAPAAEAPSTTAPVLRPTLLGEVGYRAFPSEVEGYSGFAVSRVRLGLVLTPTSWFRAVGNIEYAGEYPIILDAFMGVRAADWLEFTLGYSRPPLFASFTYEPVHTMPFPDRAPVVTSFRVRRDVGADMHIMPRSVPLEAWVRLGNGTGSPLGNDNPLPAGYASLDLVLGRAWVGASPENRTFGLRLGGGALLEEVRDRDGISGQTPLGFVYYRPVIVSGTRVVAEAHAVAYGGPLRLTIEGAMARESRSRDDDGNPSTPRLDFPQVHSYGLTVELAWVALGRPREVGQAPKKRLRRDASWDGGALEIAARYDGMWLGHGASDVQPGGSQGGGIAMKWWPADFLAAALAGYITHYDVAPIEEPDQRWSWGAVARASFFWGAGQERMSFSNSERVR